LAVAGFWLGKYSCNGSDALADLCLDSGVKLFEIADRYYQVASEEILGTAIVGRRDAVLVSTSSA
jgi:aryl-alcohol dehydrogenase-like predicted oxidoreductase